MAHAKALKLTKIHFESDLRIDELVVSAALTTAVPEPEEADGTYEDVSEKNKAEGDTYVTQAENSIEVYWTGWWPECHVVVNQELSSSCDIMLHVKSDLLGNFDIVESDSNFLMIRCVHSELMRYRLSPLVHRCQ